MQQPGFSRSWRSGLATLMIATFAATTLTAQTQYQLFMFAMDAAGQPVRDLTVNDIAMQENGVAGEVLAIEPYSLPVKVTVLVDTNLARDDGFGGSALAHLRSGLTRFFDGLPPDVEVSLIATAPNPRWLVRPTTDPVQIRKGVELIVPEEFPGRFADSLVEYAARLEVDFGGRRDPERARPEYLPVLVSIASTTVDGSQIRRDDVLEALTRIRNYRVWPVFLMFNPSGPQGVNDGTNVLIAKAVQEVTGGRYEALTKSASSSLNRLMPELAKTIATRHLRQTSQFRLTLQRPSSATGPLQNLALSVSREGVAYQLTVDGNIR